jgi:hypothetical protein
MKLKVSCTNCSKLFSVSSDNVNVTKCYTAKYGESLTITSYDCETCGFKHIVQIDNKVTSELFAKTVVMMKQKLTLSKLGRDVSTKQKQEFKDLRNILTAIRTELMIKFNGTDVRREDGTVFKLKCQMGFVDEK